MDDARSRGKLADQNDLPSRLGELGRTPVLLVSSDFDGTLSPIAPEPALAKPDREAIVALHALSKLPQTHVAVISGRALQDLASLSGLSEEVHLVGSHGSEFDPGFARSLDPKLVDLRDRIKDELLVVAGSGNGFRVEEKPASVAFHYRLADDHAAERAVDAILSGCGQIPGVHIKRGKKLIELSVVPTDKGMALAAIRHRVGATAAIFIGDDESDEDAFAVLCGPDVSVKVGGGSTKALYRVADSVEAARILATLAELREAWLVGSEAVAIERLAMLSDQRTVALVTPEARVIWMCVPRIDSAALFCELLGGPTSGFFAIKAADGTPPVKQGYVGSTFQLRTEWPGFAVTDYLDCSNSRPYQRAGRTDLIRVIEGSGRVAIEFAPRPDFGREPTRISCLDEGLQIEGSLEPMVLRAPGIKWRLVEEGPHQSAIAELELTGQATVLELRCGLSTSRELVVPEPRRREQTGRFWNVWADHLQVPPLYPELVRRSALVLKALCYGSTGAIVAAGTTGLPEHVGGVRNWDYRYCWLRDAAMAATALTRLGSPGVGTRFIDWLLGILDRDESSEWFRPVYTVTGGYMGIEAEIGGLPGYRGSRPVRVGNAAARQLQLDVFGPIMELVAILVENGAALSTEHWRLTETIVNAVSQRWHEPDHGAWEIRLPRRHHVHSKVMCWLAVDRALRIAQAFSAQQPAEWASLRDVIADDVLKHGWNTAAGSFTAAYGDAALDAAALHIGLSGLVPGDDPRFVGTVAAVERKLRRGPTVYRYLYDDGLPGREGGFHLCTAWLIEALVLAGRIGDARELLDQFTALFGPMGLASEEYCPRTRQSLGNYPQAYSHLGLINAVLSVAKAT